MESMKTIMRLFRLLNTASLRKIRDNKVAIQHQSDVARKCAYAVLVERKKIRRS